MKIVEDYIKGIQSGKIISNEFVKLAVQRHLDDLKKQKSKEYPYYFDEDTASFILNCFSFLKFTKGKWRGQPFKLMPFWAFVVWCVFGWKRKKDHVRRFRKVYVKVPRKNAKTEVLVAIGTIMFLFDGEIDPEVYWFATKKDQAKIGWQRQKVMIDTLRKENKSIRDFCDTSTYRIFTKKGLGFVAYLGRDSKTEDGAAPSCGIGDEYHAHFTDDMINVIEDGAGSRLAFLMWLITTAGYNPFSPCAQFEKRCEQILRGQIQGDSVFAMIFGIDKGDNWEDPKVWRKANPAYDDIETLPAFLQAQYELAKTQGGSKRISFLTKNLNIWTSTHETWLPDEIYQEAGKRLDIEFLRGKYCIGGLDLSAKRDLTTLSLFFPAQEELEKPYLLRLCWLPKDIAKERESKDAIPYTIWAEDGYIYLTQGNAIDYDYIYQTITGLYDTKLSRAKSEKLHNGEGLMNMFNVKYIAYDRWNEAQIVSKLIDAGVKMEPFGQGYRSMSVPVDELEIMYIKHLITHDSNEVARWHYSNVVMQKDPAGNRKPDKSKSSEKIDIVVSDLMAFGAWLGNKEEEKESVYSKRGIRTI